MQSENIRPLDSSTAILNAGATFVSVSKEVTECVEVTAVVSCDVPGTLYIDQGPNGTAWPYSSTFTIPSGGGGCRVLTLAPFSRARFVNGASNQTAFALNTYGIRRR